MTYYIKYVKEFFFLNKYTKPVSLSLSDDINILIGNYFSIKFQLQSIFVTALWVKWKKEKE